MNHYRLIGLSKSQKDTVTFLSGVKFLGVGGLLVRSMDLYAANKDKLFPDSDIELNDMYAVGLGCGFLAGVVGLQLFAIYVDHIDLFIVAGFLVLMLDVLLFFVLLGLGSYGIRGSFLAAFLSIVALVIQVWVLRSAIRNLFVGGETESGFQKFPQKTSKGMA